MGQEGVIAFGVFQALCQVMATYSKETRATGEFRHSDGSGMELADIWEITRMEVADEWQIIRNLQQVGWISLIDQQSATSVPPSCHQRATSVPENSGFVKGEGEGEGKGKGEVSCPQADGHVLGLLWNSVPKFGRQRSSKQKVVDEWKRIPKKDRPTTEQAITAMEAWKTCDEWTREDGQYVQGLHLWIKARKWESAPVVEKSTVEEGINVRTF